mmetsp:Transcript_108332/g.302040  ORF Transcript_108332/g.302040 Transcript_108332/m.302040 type:complete len:200 (+) Transcript_108332:874-1473(+)
MKATSPAQSRGLRQMPSQSANEYSNCWAPLTRSATPDATSETHAGALGQSACPERFTKYARISASAASSSSMEFADACSIGPVVFMMKSRAADRNAGRKRRVTVLRNSSATCLRATKGSCCCSLPASSTAVIASKKAGRTRATSAWSKVAAWKISAPGPAAPPGPVGRKEPPVAFSRAGSSLTSMVRNSPVTALSSAKA